MARNAEEFLSPRHNRVRHIVARLRQSHRLTLLFALTSLFLFSLCPHLAVSTPQQSSGKGAAPRQIPKGEPRFAAVEALLQQGRASEAKQRLQDILAQDPKSIEGYNLLG